MMADEDVETDSLIDQLIAEGFTYQSNGTVDGLAGRAEDDGDGDVPGDDAGDDPGDTEGEGDPGDGPAAPDDGGDGGDDHTVDDRPGAHSGKIDLRGTPLTELEADSLLHLRKLMLERPDLANEVNALIEAKVSGRAPEPAQAQAQAAVTGEQPVPPLPDFIDPDDVVNVALWRKIEELEKRDAAVISRVDNVAEAAAQAERQAHIEAAVDRFRVAHPDLTEEDVSNVRNYTSANVNVPGVMQNFPGDPVTGLAKSLEIGSLTDPSVRDKVLGTTPPDPAVKDKDRQKKLSSISGGGGATTRRAPKETKPATWNEVAKRLATELESLGGTP